MTVLLIIILILFILKIASRYLLPYLVNRYIQKVKDKFDSQNSSNSNETKIDSSKIKIKHPLKNKNSDTQNIEYTDFEEIANENKS